MSDEDKNKILQLKKQYSIYAPWADADLFQKIVNALVKPFEQLQIDKVVGIEARGFILGAAVAYKLKSGFVVIRKVGTMYKTYFSKDDVYKEEFIDYSKRHKALELARSEKGLKKGDKVLLIDDWFETGEQGSAAIKLIEKVGGKVVGIGIMIDNMKDEIRAGFAPYNLHSLVFENP